MSSDVDIVVLEQGNAPDPRERETQGEVAFRVVLHRKPRRIYVETADGSDAVGAPRWRRIDNRKRRREARCAYEALERTTAAFYERAIAAEARAVAAEERLSRFSAPQRHFPRIGAPSIDPNDATKTRVAQLVALATAASAPENEARNAAVAIARILREHPEIIR